MNKTIEEIMSEELFEICRKVQSGELGMPTVDDLQICGEIHGIIEDIHNKLQ